MRLAKQRHVLLQPGHVRELGESQPRGFIGGGASCNGVTPAIVEMLRELLDDLTAMAGTTRQPAHAGHSVRPPVAYPDGG